MKIVHVSGWYFPDSLGGTEAYVAAVAERLQAAGFGEHHVESLEFTIDYASAEDWWASQADLSARFSAALRRAGENDVAAVRAAVERHAERFTADDGTVRIPARTWVAWGAA